MFNPEDPTKNKEINIEANTEQQELKKEIDDFIILWTNIKQRLEKGELSESSSIQEIRNAMADAYEHLSDGSVTQHWSERLEKKEGE